MGWYRGVVGSKKVQVGKIEAYTFDAFEIHVFFPHEMIYTNA